MYNNEGYLYEKSYSLTNTVAPSDYLSSHLTYHHPEYTTIILMLPIDIVKGEKGILKDLGNGFWGIPPNT